jgi:hypothetical protein
MLSAANQVYAAECVSSVVNQVFAAEFVLSAANQVFPAELCCPQRIRCSLLNCVFHSESGVRCRIVYSAGNQVFIAESVLSAANQVFTAEFLSSAAN